MSKFEIREDEDGIGKVLILKSAWSSTIESYMLKHKIYALRLSDSFGFKDTDLTFLSGLTFLKSFDKLRVVKITWSKGLTSIFELKSVEKLNIQNYPNEDLSNISKMFLLKNLYLTSRKLQSLNGITNFKQLELLDLYNCPQLVSTDGIEDCKKLKTIEIEACRYLNA